MIGFVIDTKRTKALYYSGVICSCVVVIVVFGAIGGFGGFIAGVLLGAWSLFNNRNNKFLKETADQFEDSRTLDFSINELENR